MAASRAQKNSLQQASKPLPSRFETGNELADPDLDPVGVEMSVVRRGRRAYSELDMRPGDIWICKCIRPTRLDLQRSQDLEKDHELMREMNLAREDAFRQEHILQKKRDDLDKECYRILRGRPVIAKNVTSSPYVLKKRVLKLENVIRRKSDVMRRRDRGEAQFSRDDDNGTDEELDCLTGYSDIAKDGNYESECELDNVHDPRGELDRLEQERCFIEEKLDHIARQRDLWPEQTLDCYNGSSRYHHLRSRRSPDFEVERRQCHPEICINIEGNRDQYQPFGTCSTEACLMWLGHPGPHEFFVRCKAKDCLKRQGHTDTHEIFRRCSLENCVRRESHSGPHRVLRTSSVLDRRVVCRVSRCDQPAGHPGPHSNLGICLVEGCSEWAGHFGPHEINSKSPTSEPVEVNIITVEPQFYMIEAAILAFMLLSPSVREELSKQGPPIASTIRHTRSRTVPPALISTSACQSSYYLAPKLRNDQIRLFRLYPATAGSPLHGVFDYVRLSDRPSYTALSYTWGNQTARQLLTVNDGSEMLIGQNLWHFLQHQASIIEEPKVFWIDALCIDQTNVHERNHQIGLMSKIYTLAEEVHVWLGIEADDSDSAMDFLVQQARRKLQKRGAGYRSIWSRDEGEALYALCERDYWRRMWIIQELIHAKNIKVWCGKKYFEWSHFEALYVKLKTFEDASWSAHHPHMVNVMQSSAATMIWQRAHYRHPDTPPPRLQSLIEIFRDWQCTDIRDKVFALVGLAAADSQVSPDYDMSTKEVYFAVMKMVDRNSDHFANLLYQLLGLAGADVEVRGQSLIEYKSAPAERLVLTARINEDW